MTGLAPVHVPAWHVSLCVHALPSLHAAPFALLGFEHAPVFESHVPASWHWSCALHTIGLAPVHAPAWHVSLCVQALPSLHAAPFALFAAPHVPLSHVATMHGFWGAAQPAASMQPLQAPAPSHTSAPPSPHATPAALFFETFLPALHDSVVHSMPSSQTSVSSATDCTSPKPSHWFFRQSPVVCEATGAPTGMIFTPHLPSSQVSCLHSVLSPAQSFSVRHSAQPPLPSQSAPPSEHAPPAATGGFEATPAVHTSSVHSLPSTGRSASSTTSVTTPAPSHCFAWQSPAVCFASGVPFAA